MAIKPKGFTVIELIIVIVVMIILATAAVQQATGVQSLLTFQGIFEKTVFLTQRARTLASTNMDTNYGVTFNIANRRVELYEGTTSKVIDKFTAPDFVHFDVKKGAVACASVSTIEFAAQSAQPTFSCDGTILTVRVCQVQKSDRLTQERCGTKTPVRDKQFFIHKASGVPQL
jgi:prepilin-type N-terminal cleavage/methylation domain-containing protein